LFLYQSREEENSSLKGCVIRDKYIPSVVEKME